MTVKGSRLRAFSYFSALSRQIKQDRFLLASIQRNLLKPSVN